MEKVHRAFAKNFDKFELYILRNVFVAPEDIMEIQKRYQQEMEQNSADVEQWNDVDINELEIDLNVLRHEIHVSKQKQHALQMTQKELDQQLIGIEQLAVDLAFTKDIPESGRVHDYS
jgi:hypothetical protein